MPDSGQEHTSDCDDGFLVSAACLDTFIASRKFRMFLGFD